MDEKQRIANALVAAIGAHGTQTQKDGKRLKIFHPLEVALIVQRFGCSPDVIIAALLHDAPEDTEMDLNEIRFYFGDEVAGYVSDLTEKDKSLPWLTRKEQTLEILKNCPFEVALIRGADVKSNLQKLKADLDNHGKEVWGWFNEKDPKKQSQYYYKMINILLERFPRYQLFLECQKLCDDIFVWVDFGEQKEK